MACLILYPPHLLHFVDSHSLCFTNFWAGKECKYSEFVTFFVACFLLLFIAEIYNDINLFLLLIYIKEMKDFLLQLYRLTRF